MRAYRSDLAELAEFAGARARVAGVDRTDVRSFLVRLQDAGITRNSVYRKLAVIKSFYRWVDLEGLRYDARILTLTSPRQRDQLPDVPSAVEMNRLCEGEIPTACPERDRVILELLYGSGLRASELAAINLSDFKGKDALLIRGKGKKERMVPLTSSARNAIEAWLPIRAKLLESGLWLPVRAKPVSSGALGFLQHLRSRVDDATLFPRVRLETPALLFSVGPHRSVERLDVRSIHRCVKAVAKARGISPEKGHPHMLRHACATHLLNEGMPLLAISRLLGHSRLATTAIYTRVSTDRMLEVYRKAHPHARGA